jgi:hypothetical protein
MLRHVTPRRFVVLAAVVLALPSCEPGGNFTLLGYSTRPNYRCDIRTVRVPVFKNLTYRDSTRQGLEFELTKAVIREIEQKTPFKVVGPGEDADTELTGTIVQLNKNILNRNQLNEVREAETILGVEVVWRDLRSGEVISRPTREPPPPPAPDAPLDAPPPPAPRVVVFSQANFIPELGQSNATAYQRNVDRLATQLVQMMEELW